jgi:RHS repeat-associated protein
MNHQQRITAIGGTTANNRTNSVINILNKGMILDMKKVLQRCLLIISMATCSIAFADGSGTPPTDDGNELESYVKDVVSDFPNENIGVQDLLLRMKYKDVVIPGAAGLDIVINRTMNGVNGLTFSIGDHQTQAGMTVETIRYKNVTRPTANFNCLGNNHRVSFIADKVKYKPLGYQASNVPSGTMVVYKNGSILRCDNVTNKPTLTYPNGTKYLFEHDVSYEDNYVTTVKYSLSRITDKFGNYISIPNTLTNNKRVITRSDGAKVEIIYEASNLPLDKKNIKTIYYAGKQVEYKYAVGGLERFIDAAGRETKYTYASGAIGTMLKTVTLPSGAKAEYFYRGLGTKAVLSKKLTGAGMATRNFTYRPSSTGLYYQGSIGQRTVIVERDIDGDKDLTTVYDFSADFARIYKAEQYFGSWPSNTSTDQQPWLAHDLLMSEETEWEDKLFKLGTFGCLKQLSPPDFGLGGTPKCNTKRKLSHSLSISNTNGTFDKFVTNYTNYDSHNRLTRYNSAFGSQKRYIKKDYATNKDNWILTSRSKTSIGSSSSVYTTISEIKYHDANTKNGVYNGLVVPYEISSYGLLSKRINAYDSKGNTTQIEYNASKTFGNGNRTVQFSNYKLGKAQTITVPKRDTSGYMSKYRVIDNSGLVSSETDFNGVTTHYQYDGIGRKLSIDLANDTAHGDWLDTLKSYDDANRQTITKRCTLNSSGSACIDNPALIITNSLDAASRTTLVKTQDTSGGQNSTRYQNFKYDIQNQKIFASFVSNNSAETKGTYITYDEQNRLKSTSVSGRGTVTTTYLSGNKIKVQDAENNSTTTTYQAFGMPSHKTALKIESPEGVTTSFNVDVLGVVNSMTQSGKGKNNQNVSQTEYFKYDANKQLCLKIRKDVGTTAYAKNALGETLWMAEGVSNTSCTTTKPSTATSYTLDNSGSINKIDYSDSLSDDVTYQRDNNGNLKTLTAGIVRHQYNYNNQNLLEDETLTITGESPLSLYYSYNSLLHTSSTTYPDGTKVLYKPNAFGEPTEAQSYSDNIVDLSFAKSASYYANGALNSFQYGNGIVHETILNSTSLLPSLIEDSGLIGSSKMPTTAMKIGYTYDNNANVKSITDHSSFAYSLTDLSYDELDRLISTTGESGIGSSVMKYDGLGNITKYISRSRNLDYTYDYSNNRLTNVAGISGKYGSINYDSRGSITSNGEREFTFNRANQLYSTSKGSATNTYLYDGFNRRVKQSDSNGTSYSMYSQDGTLLYREDNQIKGSGTNYIYLGEKLIAKYGNIKAKNFEASRQHYRPFGETIEVQADDVGFTGHKFDTDLNLSYMQARYYDPVIGRFISNDPVGFKNIYSFNRYAYTANNPYKYIDPDGQEYQMPAHMNNNFSDSTVMNVGLDLTKIQAVVVVAMAAAPLAPEMMALRAEAEIVGTAENIAFAKAAFTGAMVTSGNLTSQVASGGDINYFDALVYGAVGTVAGFIYPGVPGYVPAGTNATSISLFENFVQNALAGSLVGSSTVVVSEMATQDANDTEEADSSDSEGSTTTKNKTKGLPVITCFFRNQCN